MCVCVCVCVCVFYISRNRMTKKNKKTNKHTE